MPDPPAAPRNILCLAPEDSSWKMLPPYASAFRKRGVEIHFLDWSLPLDTRLDAILSGLPFTPDYLFSPECGFPFLPEDIAQSRIPTIRLDGDTYTFTPRRIRWASLFDHVAVCHPGFDAIFRETIPHPGTLVLPHAVHREFFELPEIPRAFDIGWVGQASGPIYHKRAAWLPKLFSAFRTNDWSRPCTLEEVADVCRRSRIVVNIARDDYPQDANLRAFEALAAGALLITALPSELTSLGFVPGRHFVAYRHESEILTLVRRFLDDEDSRLRIAQRGKAVVLREHTYDNRVDTLLRHLQLFGQQKLAPANRWPDSRRRLMLLDYYSGHGLLHSAKSQFCRLAGRSLTATLEGAALLARVWIKQFRSGRSKA
jgi:hypothetical protein